MDFLDRYRSSPPSSRQYLEKKFPQRPIKVIFAEFPHKFFAGTIDTCMLLTLFWLFDLHAGFWLVVCVLYFTILESSSLRGSLGEYLTGIRIIHKTGRAIDWKQALSRNLTCLLTCGLSSFSSFFNRKGRAFHDRISQTLAIREIFPKE